MNSSEIVARLAACIPLHTGGFSDSIGITSIVPTGDQALATTSAAHGLAEGQIVSIIGAGAPVEIDTGTFLRTLSTATFETLQDHDLTLSESDKLRGVTINMSGANEAEFNGEFTLLRVINRRKLMIAVTDAGPTTISGSPLVDDANGNIFNGVFAATSVAASTFIYTLPKSYPLPSSGSAKVQTSLRIGAVMDVTTYIGEIYTKKSLGADQIVVQIGDTNKSKSRDEQSDAVDSSIGNEAYNPVLVDQFAVYIIQNTTDQLAAAVALDKARSDYLPIIIKCLERVKFSTGFTADTYEAVMTAAGTFGYSQIEHRKAIHVYEIIFEQKVMLDKMDTSPPEDSVAMRDVSYTLETNISADVLTADVDLDEEPIGG